MIKRSLSLCIPMCVGVGLVAAGPLRSVEPLDGGPFGLPMIALVLAFTIAELIAVEVETRNEAHSINFVEFVYVAALLLAAPISIVAARPLATLIAMGVVR